MRLVCRLLLPLRLMRVGEAAPGAVGRLGRLLACRLLKALMKEPVSLVPWWAGIRSCEVED